MSYTTTSLDGVIATDNIETPQQVIDAIASQGSIITGTVSVSSSVNTDKITISGDTINSIGATTNDIKLTNSVSGLVKIDNILTLKNNTIGSLTNNDVVIAPSGSGSLKIDNLKLTGNTISVTDTNGNLNLNPDGSGKIIIDNDLAIDRNGLTQNASGDINLTNNTGSVKIDNTLTLKNNTIGSLSNSDIIITPNGSGALRTNNLKLTGNTISATNTNGNLNLNPDGSGKIIIDNDLAIDRNGFTQTASGNIDITNSTGSLRIDNALTLKNNTIGSVGNNDVVISPNGSGALRTDNLKFDGNSISATNTNGNLNLNANGSGKIIIDNDLAIDGNGFTQTASGDINITNNTGSVKIDNTLTLKGNTIGSLSNSDIIISPNGSGALRTDNLKLTGNTISSTDNNGNIVLAPHGTGNILLGTMTFNADQVIGASQDDYILKYDHSSGTIGLEAEAVSSSPWTIVGSDITYNTGNVKVSNLTLSSEEITQSAGSDLRLTTTAKVRIDNLSFDDKTVKAETGDLTLTCDDTTRKVFIGSLPFKLDQTVGSGQDGYILTYDNSTAKILLEPPTATSNWTTSGLDIYRASKVGVGVSSSTINSQLTVADTGASHCAIQVIAGTSQNCSLKLSRGTGTWGSTGTETIGMHLDTNSLLFSRLTNLGNNLDGFSGDAMRIDVLNSKLGVASYPYAPSTTLQIGSIASGRTESVKCSTNAGAGTADRSIEVGVDSTSSFIQSNNSTNGPIPLNVYQGTNGTVMTINSAGDVGINTPSPTNSKFHVTTTSGKYALHVSGDAGPSDAQVVMTGSTYGMLLSVNNTSSTQYALAINNSSTSIVHLKNNGDLGIGTSSPKSKLHINGSYAGSDSLTSAINKYFSANNTNTAWSYTTGTQPTTSSSLYASHNIITSKYYVAHGSSTFSDRRIKDNIVDVEDDKCLHKLRLIKPKQYTYKDTKDKGTEPVWGFIAQEVAETLDYAVDKMVKAIPNVYKLASVSNDGLVLTFDEPVNLEPTNKLQLKTLVSEEHDVIVSQVLSPTSIRLTEELTEEHHTGTLGEESIVRKVFVYGQYVDDFHVLKKDAIFTVAVSALQEVDRQQQLHKNKISTLEARMSILEQRLNNAGL